MRCRETLSLEEGLAEEEVRRQRGHEPTWWYKEGGLYYEKVKRFLDVFGWEQVKVLLYEELYANPGRSLRDIFTFPGVRQDIAVDTTIRYDGMGVPRWPQLYSLLDHFIYDPSPPEKYIKSLAPGSLCVVWASKLIGKMTAPGPVGNEMHANLKSYFGEDVEKLGEVLQRDLDCWLYRRSGVIERVWWRIAARIAGSSDACVAGRM